MNDKFNGIYLRNERWCKQSGNCVGNYEGPPTLSENDNIYELWSTNGLILDRSFHPPSAKYAFCFVARCCTLQKEPNHTLPNASQIRWRRIVNVNEAIEIRSLVSPGPGLKHFKLAMVSRRAAFSGNASLIATFSSFASVQTVLHNNL